MKQKTHSARAMGALSATALLALTACGNGDGGNGGDGDGESGSGIRRPWTGKKGRGVVLGSSGLAWVGGEVLGF